MNTVLSEILRYVVGIGALFAAYYWFLFLAATVEVLRDLRAYPHPLRSILYAEYSHKDDHTNIEKEIKFLRLVGAFCILIALVHSAVLKDALSVIAYSVPILLSVIRCLPPPPRFRIDTAPMQP